MKGCGYDRAHGPGICAHGSLVCVRYQDCLLKMVEKAAVRYADKLGDEEAEAAASSSATASASAPARKGAGRYS